MASSSFQRNKHSPSSAGFFKIVLRQNLEDGNIEVPKTFSMKYGDSVPNPVYLKPRDGTAWKIDWSEYDGAILFENGWKEFASYYSLDHGHLLWFEYNQTSNIEVHIFDKTCLEIDYPSMDHISDDDSIEILNELPPRGWPRKTEKAAPKTPSPSTSKMFTSSATTEVDHIDDDNMAKVENEPPRRGRGRPRKTEKAAPKTPSPCTSKMFTSSAKTKEVKWCPEIHYPSKDHIDDDNMVENEPPRRGRGRPRKTEKAASNTPSPCTSKMFTSSAMTRVVKWCPEIDYPSRRGRGRPRKTEKAAPKTPSSCTSTMFTSSAKARGVKWWREKDYPCKDHINDDNMVKVENEPPRRGRGRPRKTGKAALKTPSACTSKMFTSSAKTRCPEIDYPSKDHIDDHNMVKVENEPPRRGRGRPRKKLKAAAEVSSPSTSKILMSSVKTGDVEKAPDKQNWMQCCKNEASQSE
nr:B3 domain-containing protein Os01g0905400 isoform X2 [Arachis hypogaea]